MTKLCIYQCDICGKDFEFEDDCRKHEMEHITAKLKDAVVMMDSQGKVLPLDDIHTAIERTYAIYVGCKEAADILWGAFDDEGYCTPIENIETSIQYPALFTYDQDKYRWLYMRDLEEEYNRLLDLKITAENTLLH